MWSGSDIQESIPTTALAHDQGLLRGWGVFETMLAVGLEVPLWPRHWARLQHGARQLEIPLPPAQTVLDSLQQILRTAQLTFPPATNLNPTCRLRLTITAGDGRGWTQPGEHPHCVLTATPCPVPRSIIEQPGLRLLTYPHPFSTSPVLQHCKHTSYLPWLMAARHARLQGCDDAVLLDSSGYVIETSHRNLFVWRDNELWTPPLSTGCLPGIMRGLVLETAARLGLCVREKRFQVVECRAATHVFATSAVTCCQTVREWDAETWSISPLPPQLLQLERELHQTLAPAENPS